MPGTLWRGTDNADRYGAQGHTRVGAGRELLRTGGPDEGGELAVFLLRGDRQGVVSGPGGLEWCG